ncbi:DUF3566 domain-containing protein [Krasilnikoviella flava]|uniref:DUF3566 domain-containing protein n=1 Tax=Krasilnikoviella flava TaxID=526729 RepID=A0A1T5KCR1_9MICO|nr:DUF3566 domain-containing protein [Krasilnikoviella flava]SKC61464.1 Transmembrane protein of unknown function [Krasilnikoviella flava]
MTENSASTRASSVPPVREAEIDEATHRRNPVPTQAGTGAVHLGQVPAPPAPPTVAPASSSAAAPAVATGGAATQGASPVKEGAVKAAAAALAAARSAAKKVQSVMPEAPAKGQDAADTPARPKGAAKSVPAEPRPEMHYSAGGVHGTAAPAAATAGPMVGTAQPGVGPRRVRLSVSRVDPWSIMKLAFLLSVAIGFITVVATMVVWYVLNDMGTFATMQTFLSDTIGPQAVNLMQFVQFDRVVSLSVLIAIVNVVLLTALTTIMAILYNITAALVGGVHLTLTDE